MAAGYAALVFAGSVACADDSQGTYSLPVGPTEGGPTVEAIRSVTLAENDSLYIGRIGGLHVASNGDFLIPDIFSDRVVRFSRDGFPVRTYGRSGGGPGEFGILSSAVASAGDWVLAGDHSTRGISIFDKATGQFVGFTSVPGVTTRIAVRNDTVYLGTIHPDTPRAVDALAVPPPSDSGQMRGLEPLELGLLPLPHSYRVSPTIRTTYGIVPVAAGPRTLAVGFAADPYVRFLTKRRDLVDSVFLPSRLRRGVPDDLVQRATYETASLEDIVGMTSILLALGYTDRGELVAVHSDQTLLSSKARAATAVVYVSLLSSDAKRACVDALVPTDTVSLPQVALTADTLWVAEQVLVRDGASQQVGQTVITAYRISSEGCKWNPTTAE